MQGLFGVVSTRQSASFHNDIFESSVAKIEPPAWYRSVHWSDPSGRILLGRLGTAILEAQPAVHVDEAAVCLLEGEYLSAGETSGGWSRSTKELASLYARHGANVPGAIEGSFLVAVLDRERECLWIFNDRFGHRPLYYYHDGTRLVFAPSTKLLRHLARITPTLDIDATAQIFRYQQILDNRSLFNEFSLLAPASLLRFDLHDGALQLNEYWNLNEISLEAGISWREAVEHGSDLVGRSIRRCFDATSRVGVFLSGGLDSRIILAALGDAAAGVPVANYGVDWSQDVVYARQVARAARASYHHIQPEHPGWTRAFIEEFFKYSYTPLHYYNGGQNTIGHQAAEIMDINLSGVPGDAILGELPESAAMAHVDERLWMLDELDHYWTAGHFHPGTVGIDHGERLFVPEFQAELADRARDALARVVDEYHCPFGRHHDFLYLRTRARRCQGNLLHVERSVMENRVPFYDYALVDFFYSVPYSFRVGRRLHIAVLNRLSRRLSWIPTAGECVPPLLDERVLKLFHWRNRLRGMAHRWLSVVQDVPTKEINAWPYHTRTDTAPWIAEVLFGNQAKSGHFLHRPYVESLLVRQKQGDDRASWVLAQLLSFEFSLRCG